MALQVGLSQFRVTTGLKCDLQVAHFFDLKAAEMYFQ